MNINKSNNLRIIITFLISSFIITIIHNLKLNLYLKDFILPITILIISYIYNIKKINLSTNNKSYYLLISIILILISNLILKIANINIFLNIIIIPILLSIFFLKLTNKNYNIERNFLKWFFKLFPNNLFKNLSLIKNNINLNNKIDKSKLNSIVKGISIGLIFAVIIITLLTSADSYFNIFINNITSNLTNLNNFHNIFKNIILFIFIFIIFFSTFINIIKYKNEKISISINKADITSAKIILFIINSIFTLFLISEISKITTNFLNIPKEYTYANYAREGFFQLLLVTTINFSIILYYLYYTNIVKENKTIKNLILLLVSFSIILIFNSYYRMFLYINAYGFTILRLQVLLFLLMELILFITIIKKIIFKLKYKDSSIFTFIILSTYIINLYTCNNTIINLINK